MDIEFVDEPPGLKHRAGAKPKTEWQEIADKLIANVGQWAKVRTYPTAPAARSAAAYIRSGANKAFREHRWEATSSDHGLYVRCVEVDQ